MQTQSQFQLGADGQEDPSYEPDSPVAQNLVSQVQFQHDEKQSLDDLSSSTSEYKQPEEAGGALEASDLFGINDQKNSKPNDPIKERDGIIGKLGEFSMSGLSASNMADSVPQRQDPQAYKSGDSNVEDMNSLENRLQKIRMGLNLDYQNDFTQLPQQ